MITLADLYRHGIWDDLKSHQVEYWHLSLSLQGIESLRPRVWRCCCRRSISQAGVDPEPIRALVTPRRVISTLKATISFILGLLYEDYMLEIYYLFKNAENTQVVWDQRVELDPLAGCGCRQMIPPCPDRPMSSGGSSIPLCTSRPSECTAQVSNDMRALTGDRRAYLSMYNPPICRYQ